MFDVVKSNFNVEAQEAFFLQPADVSNMFHYAARNENEKVFATLIGCTRGLLSIAEIKSVLIYSKFSIYLTPKTFIFRIYTNRMCSVK